MVDRSDITQKRPITVGNYCKFGQDGQGRIFAKFGQNLYPSQDIHGLARIQENSNLNISRTSNIRVPKTFKNDYSQLDKYPSMCKTSLLERRNSKIIFFDCLSYFGHHGLAKLSFHARKVNVYTNCRIREKTWRVKMNEFIVLKQ